MKWKCTGVVSIPGIACPCNSMEFLFYLIGGSHPLFKMQVQNRQMLLNNSDKHPASALSLFLCLSLSLWLIPVSPVVPAKQTCIGRAITDSAVGRRGTNYSQGGVKGKTGWWSQTQMRSCTWMYNAGIRAGPCCLLISCQARMYY